MIINGERTSRKKLALLIATQNNAIRTNYIKVKIENPQQKSKCRLYGERNKTVNLFIRDCSKLEHKQYKTRHD